MAERRHRPFGTNIHIDAFRPWLSGEKVERSLPEIAQRGFDHIRIVGDPVLVSDDGTAISDPQRIVERIVQLCRSHGLRALPLSWNVISDSVAKRYPLVDADGGTYPRGHWGLFNFSHPQLRAISIRALEATMLELRKYPDVFEYFQPTLEWQLASYPPHGWFWEAYAGEMRRTAPVQVMYDEDSLSRWSDFLKGLPKGWRSSISNELAGTVLEDVPPPEITAAPGFSAHRLAWARYRSRLMGDYFADVYRHLKPLAGNMRLLIPEVMPLPLIDSGLTLASLGHNPEYWLASGDIGDMLTVSVYDSVFEITAYPGHLDGALDHPAAMMYFAELARSYDLPLAVTEQGANSYHHTEDGQRYLVMRGALAAAAFDLESHSHLLWNDEPGFEGVHEQFYGVVRDQHQQAKPSGHEVARVGWLVRHADTSGRRASPQVMIVVPRESMDVGLEGWTSDALAGPWMQVSGVTTSSLVAERGLPPSARVVVFTGRHTVGTAAMLERVRGTRVIIYADAVPFGIDDPALRGAALKELTGLSRRPMNVTPGTIEVDWPDDGAAGFSADRIHLNEALDIRRKDLPSGATVLCSVRGTDRVLAYQFMSTIVSALPVGRPVDEIDVDLTRWTRTLLGRVLQGQLDLPYEVLDGADLTYNLIGDTLTVVNGRSGKGTARVSFQSGAIIASIDVAAGQFSAVQLSSHPTLAVLSGEGQVSVNGKVVLQNDAHYASMLAAGELRVEPLHGRDGTYISGLEANGVALSMHHEHGIDVWTGAVSEDSAVIRTNSKLVVNATACFRSRMTVRPAPNDTGEPGRASYFTSRAVEDRALRHTLLATPSAAWIEWEAAAGQSGPVCCEYTWWSGMGESRGVSVHELEGQSGRLTVPLPSEFPALVRCVLAAGSEHDVKVDLVYEAEDTLDTLTARIDENLLRTRLMHPLRREGFDVVEANATLFEGPDERAARLVIGHRGMHTRHLQWSEDWVDFYG